MYMDLFSFIVEILKAIAWPAVAAMGMLTFRTPINGLITRLATDHIRAKIGDNEFVIGAIEVEKRSEKLAEAIAAPNPPTNLRLESFAETARYSPKATVAEAWRGVEQSAAAALQLSTTTVTSKQIENTLKGAIEEDKFKLFQDLRLLRNKAVHSPESTLTTESAIAYAKAAERLQNYFSSRSESE